MLYRVIFLSKKQKTFYYKSIDVSGKFLLRKICQGKLFASKQGKMITEISHNGVKAFDEDIFLDKMSSFDTLYLAGYELGIYMKFRFMLIDKR